MMALNVIVLIFTSVVALPPRLYQCAVGRQSPWDFLQLICACMIIARCIASFITRGN